MTQIRYIRITATPWEYQDSRTTLKIEVETITGRAAMQEITLPNDDLKSNFELFWLQLGNRFLELLKKDGG